MAQQKLILFTAEGRKMNEDREEAPAAIRVVRRRLSTGERLLRNSAIACALLFGMLALKNIPHHTAQTAARLVEHVLTADFDIDETLGELHFVRRMLPESALVFWNMPSSGKAKRPVEGDILHAYTEQQPWYTFVARHGDPVSAPLAGVLKSAKQMNGGDWMLTLQHPDGSETILAYVDRGTIEKGESVAAGEVIASAALQGCIYLEYAVDGKPVRIEEYDS